ncbi:hypothetical protein MRB53_008080 [Persea americana]|uniref:Uncharacterized protein n=1 Tax=Persea americana TaxID=3435 RepID=A0ACC2MKQ3_PERAE|nr:hypothetical protein MRB53_008080 [Persea americana]
MNGKIIVPERGRGLKITCEAKEEAAAASLADSSPATSAAAPPPPQPPPQSAMDAFVEAAAVGCDIRVNIDLPAGTELAEPSQEGSIWTQERGSAVEFLESVAASSKKVPV